MSAGGERVRLTSRAADGFALDAWRVPTRDARRGGLVLAHEIWGVTGHIRRLAAEFADDGYEVIAPALFDRLSPGFEGGYDPAGVAEGRRRSEATAWDTVVGDLQAAVEALAPPVFVVGWCWGGTAAWAAACRCTGLSAASCWYGRRIPELVDETPRCPTILHFGRRDASIPPETVEAIGAAHPDLPIWLYEAGHGFASDRATDHDADSSRLAKLRTLQLFHRAAGRGETGG